MVHDSKGNTHQIVPVERKRKGQHTDFKTRSLHIQEVSSKIRVIKFAALHIYVAVSKNTQYLKSDNSAEIPDRCQIKDRSISLEAQKQ
mmetsp:Transcript_27113/g.56350  ORF Transcript_27113/g.56350 Transcript_27113/m.56350 type:complete len:88 (-) Transcript_27113:27-290(-)